MPVLVVGLLSDTHVPRRLKRLPETVLDALAGVDLILHAGDVGDPAALEPLRAIAPVHAVRGNVHLHEFSGGGAALPTVVELYLAGRRIVLTHGHQPGLFGLWLKGRDVLVKYLRLMDGTAFNRRIARRLGSVSTLPPTSSSSATLTVRAGSGWTASCWSTPAQSAPRGGNGRRWRGCDWERGGQRWKSSIRR